MKKILLPALVLFSLCQAFALGPNRSNKIPHRQTKATSVSGASCPNKIQDNINLPFVDDKQVLGAWQSVDFVDKIEDFNPRFKTWKGDLYLKELVFKDGGAMGENGEDAPWLNWTSGHVLHHGDVTDSKYIIKDGYMFFEWKSGDYSCRGMAPKYYVLKNLKS
ncbi:MAG: hypothetical protein FWF35_02150 [Elusimicrobia bacterium]|nr:hypothetical protein [Elusimicrobiota bacterium]